LLLEHCNKDAEMHREHVCGGVGVGLNTTCR